jgi:predicted  nucleic acid-binding Zn-ribbon protein
MTEHTPELYTGPTLHDRAVQVCAYDGQEWPCRHELQAELDAANDRIAEVEEARANAIESGSGFASHFGALVEQRKTAEQDLSYVIGERDVARAELAARDATIARLRDILRDVTDVAHSRQRTEWRDNSEQEIIDRAYADLAEQPSPPEATGETVERDG